MISTGILRKYVGPGTIFIETGTDTGFAVEAALNFGTRRIYSIEVDEEKYELARQKFADKTNVHLFLGDSGQILPEVLKLVSEPAVFWIDAHDEYCCPIFEELSAIAKHPVKTHTILVDDIRLFRSRHWKVSMGEVCDKLVSINPDYTIMMEDGYVPADILVARLYS